MDEVFISFYWDMKAWNICTTQSTIFVLRTCSLWLLRRILRYSWERVSGRSYSWWCSTDSVLLWPEWMNLFLFIRWTNLSDSHIHLFHVRCIYSACKSPFSFLRWSSIILDCPVPIKSPVIAPPSSLPYLQFILISVNQTFPTCSQPHSSFLACSRTLPVDTYSWPGSMSRFLQ